MWSKSREEHCSDEHLLAYLDRELGRREAECVARHLGSCWGCRSRLHELEQEAQNIARLIEECPLSSPDRLAELKGAFFAVQRRYEEGRGEGRSKRLVWLAAALTATAAAALAIVIWTGGGDRSPDARATLTAVQAAEMQIGGSRQVVRQVIGVRIAESVPSRGHLEGRLEIWSDAPGNRYSERWTDEAGVLKRAVWVSSPQRAYRYESGRLVSGAPDTRGPVPIVELAGNESARIEEILLSWLRSRPWRPVLLSAYFAEFVSGDGVRLLVSTEGADVIRLVAQRAVGDARILLTFDVAAHNHHPRLLTVRYQSPRRVFEFRLASDKWDIVPAAAVHAAEFEPAAQFLLSHREPRRNRPTAQIEPPASARPRMPAAETGLVEVLYTLHRAGACRNEFLDLTREYTDRLHLRLIAASPERREFLLATLGALPMAPRLDVDIEIGRPPRERPAHTPKSVVSRPAIEAWDTAYLHALALVRLAERPETRLDGLSQADRHLLDLMIRDHLREMRLHLGQVRKELAPLKFATPQPSGHAMRAIAVPESWQSVVREQFRTIDVVDDSLQKLIANPADPLSELRTEWCLMEEAIARMDAVVAGR